LKVIKLKVEMHPCEDSRVKEKETYSNLMRTDF